MGALFRAVEPALTVKTLHRAGWALPLLSGPLRSRPSPDLGRRGTLSLDVLLGRTAEGLRARRMQGLQVAGDVHHGAGGRFKIAPARPPAVQLRAMGVRRSDDRDSIKEFQGESSWSERASPDHMEQVANSGVTDVPVRGRVGIPQQSF